MALVLLQKVHGFISGPVKTDVITFTIIALFLGSCEVRTYCDFGSQQLVARFSVIQRVQEKVLLILCLPGEHVGPLVVLLTISSAAKRVVVSSRVTSACDSCIGSEVSCACQDNFIIIRICAGNGHCIVEER